MSKSYLRYKLQDTLGVISTSTVESLFLPNSDDKIVITPTLEDVTIWHIRTNLTLKVLRDPDNRSLVTSMAVDTTGFRLAVGYENGSIRIWDVEHGEVVMVLNGHNIAVTSLRFDSTGANLFSGSRDTDIVLWDITSQQGIYRLKGHKDEVTDFNFLTITTQVPYPSTPTDILSTATYLEPQYVRSTIETKILVSSSKDGCVRLWDLGVQHCLYTLTGHPGEVWSFDILTHPSTHQALLVTGSTDKFLRSWSIKTNIVVTNPDMESTEIAALFERTGISFSGVIDRPAGKRRVIRVRFSPCMAKDGEHESSMPSRILVVHGQDKCVETYIVRTLADKKKRQKRRQKRYREKITEIKNKIQQKKATQQQLEDAEADVPPQYLPSDDLEVCLPIRVDQRINSMIFSSLPVRLRKAKYQLDPKDPQMELHAVVATSENALEKWVAPLIPLVKTQNETISVNDKLSPYKIVQTISTPGHRSGIRACDLSSDDTLLLTTAGIDMKFWCMRQHKHLRTISLYTGDSDDMHSSSLPDHMASHHVDIDDNIDDDSILSCCFLPGNRHVLVGTKLGYVDLYDIDSTTLLHRERSDDKSPIWSISIQPDGKGFATTCGKQVWFWDLEIIQVNDEEPAIETMNDSDDHDPKGKKHIRGSVVLDTKTNTIIQPRRVQRRLVFTQTRILQLTDEALCIKHSPDGRYVAVGLLDSTVRIFHNDTLAFFLSLYGHKLPILTIDISDDSTMILTGSSDKTVKLWGLDFGDCRRSLIAHDNSVMKVKFVPNTHYFFTIGKDHLVRYWDADRFYRISTLQGHHAEVWALAVSHKGDFIITSGNDKSIRRWYQSDEIILKGDEQEELLDGMVDSSLTHITDTSSKQIGDIEGGIVKGEHETEDVWTRGLRGKSTIELAEYLVNALDICKNETDNWKRYHELVRKVRRERLEASRKKKKRGASNPNPLPAKTPKNQSTIAALRELQSEHEKENEINLPLDGSDIVAPDPSPLLQGKTPSQYILMVLRAMPLAELSTILITIPYESAMILLEYLSRLLDQGIEVELCTRTALVLIKIHKQQLAGSTQHVDILTSLRHHARVRLLRHRKMIGTNVAALQFMTTKIQEDELSRSFAKAAEADRKGGIELLEKKKKNNKYMTRAAKRARTTIKHLKIKGAV